MPTTRSTLLRVSPDKEDDTAYPFAGILKEGRKINRACSLALAALFAAIAIALVIWVVQP